MRLKYHTVVQKQAFRSLRTYTKNDPKRDAKSHYKLYKNQLMSAHGSDFSDLGWFRERSIFRRILIGKKLVPKIEKIIKKGPRRRPTANATSRAEAKEGGGGEVNLPPGSEG